jgi:DNA-binding NarL/FixJ family response regulator
MTDTADTNVVTIVVADDHPMVRRGLVATLEDEADFKVIGEAGSGDEAVALVRQLRPRVVILDVNMPSSGLGASRAIKAEFPHTLTVMFSFRQDPEIIRASQEAGASGYIVKGASGAAVIDAVRSVIDGRSFFQVSPK